MAGVVWQYDYLFFVISFLPTGGIAQKCKTVIPTNLGAKKKREDASALCCKGLWRAVFSSSKLKLVSPASSSIRLFRVKTCFNNE